jgi:hypothetical protein
MAGTIFIAAIACARGTIPALARELCIAFALFTAADCFLVFAFLE